MAELDRIGAEILSGKGPRLAAGYGGDDMNPLPALQGRDPEIGPLVGRFGSVVQPEKPQLPLNQEQELDQVQEIALSLGGGPRTVAGSVEYMYQHQDKVNSWLDAFADGVYGGESSTNGRTSVTRSQIEAIVRAGQDPDALGVDFQAAQSGHSNGPALNPDEWDAGPQPTRSLLDVAYNAKVTIDGLSSLEGWKAIHLAVNNFLSDSSLNNWVNPITPLTPAQKAAASATARSVLAFAALETEPMALFGLPEMSGESRLLPDRNKLFGDLRSVRPRSVNMIDPAPGQFQLTADQLSNVKLNVPYIYAIDEANNIQIAERGSAGVTGVKHTQLTGGGPARGAGELLLQSEGNVMINNLSGRYRAQSEGAIDRVQSYMEELGLKVTKSNKEF